jgi:hypothetical protein
MSAGETVFFLANCCWKLLIFSLAWALPSAFMTSSSSSDIVESTSPETSSLILAASSLVFNSAALALENSILSEASLICSYFHFRDLIMPQAARQVVVW